MLVSAALEAGPGSEMTETADSAALCAIDSQQQRAEPKTWPVLGTVGSNGKFKIMFIMSLNK